jgi:HSP20 family protein
MTMLTTAWTTIPMLDRLLTDVMSDVTGTAFGSTGTRGEGAFAPAIDVHANDDEIAFVCDVPGVAERDLEITLEGGTLTLRGQRSYDGHEHDKVWLGRRYGSFTRTFTLPSGVDGDRMTASLADGVLTVRVPKLAQAKPRRIPIGADRQAKQLEQK